MVAKLEIQNKKNIFCRDYGTEKIENIIHHLVNSFQSFFHLSVMLFRHIQQADWR